MKKYLQDIIAILVFAIIAILYFTPAVIDGRVLLEHDAAAGVGAGQEAKEYYQEHGERTRWTNSLFSGMPTYQISPSYNSTDSLKRIEKAYSLYLPEYVWHIFIMMLGFYILLRAFKCSPLISSLGGIIWAFSSYFFILIAAGHLWKFITLAYIPPTIAGIVLVYRKKYLLGAILATLFGSLQIVSNHIQMSYYFMFVIFFLLIAFFIKSYKNKELKHYAKTIGIIIISGLIAIAINSSNLYHTYQYSKESTRGESELTQSSFSEPKGIDKAYITQWSYGIGETLTLLIPNYKGGASKPLVLNEKAVSKGNPQFYKFYAQFTQYFGEQPFTAGPVYIGAFVCLLFIIGSVIVKGPIKWALLGATFFSITLSWGKNFMLLTDFFIDYIPLYSKFRAVSSILVIAEFTIPLLAILGLVELLREKNNIAKYKKTLLISFVSLAGLTVIIALYPYLFNSLISAREAEALLQAPTEFAIPFITSLEDIRAAIVTSDAWRSFIVICIGSLILYLFYRDIANKTSTVLLIIALCLFDLWSINKRYLNDELFVPKSNISKTFTPTEADKYILKDKSLNYRVVNFTTDTFNDNMTSYWHKSIGGYHAAKLRRYQEIIQHGIYNEMEKIKRFTYNDELDLLKKSDTPILNMLNTKYFILGTQKEQVFCNPFTLGNAWFVDNIISVKNADEELAQLKKSDPSTTAIINTNTTSIDKLKTGKGTINLTQYEPNRLVYNAKVIEDGLVLFSEIYYPGWKAKVQEKEIPLLKTNYILRGAILPVGEYKLILSFEPDTLSKTEKIAYSGLFMLTLGVILLGYKYYKKAR